MYSGNFLISVFNRRSLKTEQPFKSAGSRLGEQFNTKQAAAPLWCQMSAPTLFPVRQKHCWPGKIKFSVVWKEKAIALVKIYLGLYMYVMHKKFLLTWYKTPMCHIILCSVKNKNGRWYASSNCQIVRYWIWTIVPVSALPTCLHLTQAQIFTTLAPTSPSSSSLGRSTAPSRYCSFAIICVIIIQVKVPIMTGQGEAGQHKAVQASWHRFYLLTSRLLASKWARKWQKIATLQKRWSHSMTVVNRYYFQFQFLLCTLMYNSIYCRKSYRRNQTLRMWLADSIFRTVLQMETTTTAFGISLYGFVKTSTNKPSNWSRDKPR